MSIVHCKHCGLEHNSHCKVEWTCHCGRPIDREVTVLGVLDESVKFTKHNFDSGGYPGMNVFRNYNNQLVIDGNPVTIGARPCFIDKKRVFFLIK